jgi:hypothetical protein
MLLRAVVGCGTSLLGRLRTSLLGASCRAQQSKSTIEQTKISNTMAVLVLALVAARGRMWPEPRPKSTSGMIYNAHMMLLRTSVRCFNDLKASACTYKLIRCALDRQLDGKVMRKGRYGTFS